MRLFWFEYRKIFLTDDAVHKVVYLATTEASGERTMLVRQRKPALNLFMIELFMIEVEDRQMDYV